MYLKRASLQVFFDVYKERYRAIGPNLIVDSRHGRAWVGSAYKDKLANPMITFDSDVIKKFTHTVVTFSGDAIDYHGVKKRRNNVERPSKLALEMKIQQHLYILSLYCDSVTGRMNNKRTIHPQFQTDFGF